MNRFGTVNGVAAAKNETVTARKEMANLRTRCVAWFQNCMAAFVAFVSCMIWRLNAFALNIDTNYTVKTSVANVNPEGLVLGVSFWICRLIGIGMFIWGLYGYITARRGGDSEAMNGAMNTLIGGLALVCMPSILKAVGII